MSPGSVNGVADEASMLTSEDSNVPSPVAEKGFDQMDLALIGFQVHL